MVDTTRLATGFDVEVQLGGGWFQVAIQGLIDTGVVGAPPPAPPDTPILVTGVEVLADDPGHDLEVQLIVGVIPITALATLVLSDDGTQLTITTDQDFEITVPFGVLTGLAGPPTLIKVAGDAATDPAIAILANLDIRASGQDGDPLPADQHVARGDASLGVSFLPQNRHIAFGVGAQTFPRLANDIWHTQLTADDGSHPLPDEEDPKGTWQVAEMVPQNGRIRLRLRGEVPIVCRDRRPPIRRAGPSRSNARCASAGGTAGPAARPARSGRGRSAPACRTGRRDLSADPEVRGAVARVGRHRTVTPPAHAAGCSARRRGRRGRSRRSTRSVR